MQKNNCYYCDKEISFADIKIYIATSVAKCNYCGRSMIVELD